MCDRSLVCQLCVTGHWFVSYMCKVSGLSDRWFVRYVCKVSSLSLICSRLVACHLCDTSVDCQVRVAVISAMMDRSVVC